MRGRGCRLGKKGSGRVFLAVKRPEAVGGLRSRRFRGLAGFTKFRVYVAYFGG